MRTPTRFFVTAVMIVFVSALVPAQVASFHCTDRLIGMNRFSGAHSVEASPESLADSKLVKDAEFGKFDAKYSLDSVRLAIYFKEDPNPNRSIPAGRLHVFARVKGEDQKGSWQEITDGEATDKVIPSWYDDWEIRAIFKTDLDSAPERTDEDGKIDPDPDAQGQGDPQVRLQQAEPGVPVFLLKFIGFVPAGPYPDARAETAVVLDLRSGRLETPAGVHCTLADYPSLPKGSEFLSCTWESGRQDFVCETDSEQAKKWKFLLMAGKKLSGSVSNAMKKKTNRR